MKEITSYKSSININIENYAEYKGELTKVYFIATPFKDDSFFVTVLNIENMDFNDIEIINLEFLIQDALINHFNNDNCSIKSMYFEPT